MRNNLLHLLIIAFIFISALDVYASRVKRAIEPVPINHATSTERRIALVIGNGGYESSPLKNPVNDADDVSSRLGRLGFKVTKGRDMTRKEMYKAIRKFGNDLKMGGVGLFYYAGHGMQVRGKNYLIPVGVDIGSEDEIEYEAIDAGMVMRKMESAGNTMNMVFLDACRDNPFARSFRTGSKGLAQMDAPSGSLVVYSTAPGSVAADGSGRNGTFTRNLLLHLNTSGLEVGQLLRRVRISVKKETGGKQIPWESSSLEGSFYFVLPEDTGIDDEMKRLQAEQEKLRRERKKLEQERILTEGQRKLTAERRKLDKERRLIDKEMSREKEDKIQVKWSKWMDNMQDAVNEAIRFENNTYVNSIEKVKTWQNVIDGFHLDNPNSNSDEELRSHVTGRIKYWRDYRGPTKQSSTIHREQPYRIKRDGLYNIKLLSIVKEYFRGKALPESLHIYPSINKKKLNNYLAKIKKKLGIEIKPSDVIFYHDATVFGSGKSGVALTNNKLVVYGIDFKGSCYLHDIISVEAQRVNSISNSYHLILRLRNSGLIYTMLNNSAVFALEGIIKKYLDL